MTDRLMTDDEFVRHAQSLLGVTVDGLPGKNTLDRLHERLGVPAAPVAPPVVPVAAEWDRRSLGNLAGVHPDLVRVMSLARERSPIAFTVIEGLRTVERQRQLVAQGASKTMNSRHITGHAVDIVPHRPDGVLAFDWPLYHRLAPVIKEAARELGVPIEWGGDWRSFKDGPHWQLPHASYPA